MVGGRDGDGNVKSEVNPPQLPIISSLHLKKVGNQDTGSAKSVYFTLVKGAITVDVVDSTEAEEGELRARAKNS
jgi:hypothetical protein